MLVLSYRNLLFYPIFGLDYYTSMEYFLWFCMAVSTLGIVLTLRRRRNDLSMFVNVVAPFAIYFVFSFFRIIPGVILTVACLAAAAGVFYGAAVVVNYLRDKHRGIMVPNCGRCMMMVLLNTRTIVVTVLASVVGIMLVLQMLGVPLLEAKPEQETVAQESGQTIAQNMDTILLLQEGKWEKLTPEERLQVLKTVSDIEANYLGIPEVRVCADNMEGRYLGHYVDVTQCITLSYECLASYDAYTMLCTVIHETYHAYQYRLVDLYDRLEKEDRDLYLMRAAAHYSREFSDYNDGSENYLEYATQHCEMDSDSYAAAAAEDYYERIRLYYMDGFHSMEQEYGS